MSSSKLLSLQKLVLIFTLTLLMGCGSFGPTSFVSSDGIYYAEKAPAETKSTLYYKNYFKEKEIEFENRFNTDTLITNSDFVNSSQITYNESNAAWGEIPNTVTITFDMFDNLYHKRYFGFGYYNPYYGHYPYGRHYPYYDPFYGYSYGYGYGYGYWDPFYGYGYWDPFWGPYSWGPNRFYGYPYNYNMLGYNRYNRPYYQDDFSNRENSNISYNKGRRGSANNVVVYSDGKSSRSNNDQNKNSKNVNVNRSYLGPSTGQYNGRNVKNFDIIVERGDGSKDKVRNYATKPGNPTVNQDGNQSPRVYLNRGSSNAVYGSATLNSYNRINNNSKNTDQKRYYTNPQYNNNSNWRISGRNYVNPSNRSGGSRSNSNSVRSYSNPSSNNNSSVNSYSSSINNSSSNISRSSSNSISSPSRGSVSGGASISRGSSSSAGSVRGSR